MGVEFGGLSLLLLSKHLSIYDEKCFDYINSGGKFVPIMVCDIHDNVSIVSR